jgi:hypothetical protein
MFQQRLPTVVLSSVVRSAYQGESHGGVYLVDLETEETRRALDWSDASIDWQGRGGDRGLRGIAFDGERIFLAASDEVFVYDREWNRQGSFRNPYLKHCHEIFVSGRSLFLTSTGFDSVLEFDLSREVFVRGYGLRYAKFWKIRRKLIELRPRPSFRLFDPTGRDGPTPGDSSHINNVTVQDGSLFVSGTGLGNLWRIREGLLERYARIPYGSHNAQPFRGGVLLNHTRSDRIVLTSLRGDVRAAFPLPRYEQSELEHSELPSDLARQAFGRGLAIAGENLLIGGSSPATVTVYRADPVEVVKSINLTLDVRNAVHGLEIWPFGF